MNKDEFARLLLQIQAEGGVLCSLFDRIPSSNEELSDDVARKFAERIQKFDELVIRAEDVLPSLTSCPAVTLFLQNAAGITTRQLHVLYPAKDEWRDIGSADMEKMLTEIDALDFQNVGNPPAGNEEPILFPNMESVTPEYRDHGIAGGHELTRNYIEEESDFGLAYRDFREANRANVSGSKPGRPTRVYSYASLVEIKEAIVRKEAKTNE